MPIKLNCNYYDNFSLDFNVILICSLNNSRNINTVSLNNWCLKFIGLAVIFTQINYIEG